MVPTSIKKFTPVNFLFSFTPVSLPARSAGHPYASAWYQIEKEQDMPELIFKGKEFVYNHHLAVPLHPLVPHPDKPIGEARMDGNLIIQGDNLLALKSLLPMYELLCVSC